MSRIGPERGRGISDSLAAADLFGPLRSNISQRFSCSDMLTISLTLGRSTMKTLIALSMLTVVVASTASAQTTKASSLAALSTQPSMNVFRRFSVDAVKMTGFYGDVLGLKALPPLRMPGGGSMILFQVGSGQVKL